MTAESDTTKKFVENRQDFTTKKFVENRQDFTTAEEATKFLRKWFLNPKKEFKSKRPRQIFIHMNIWAPVTEDTGFSVHDSVQISYKDAVKLFKRIESGYGERGGKIRVNAYSDSHFWIG